MKLKKKLLSTMVVAQLAGLASAFGAGHVQSADVRCGELKAPLSPAQAVERNLWARRCFPWLKGQIQADGHILAHVPNRAPAEAFVQFVTSVKGEPGPMVQGLPTDRNAACVDPSTILYLGVCVTGCYPDDQVLAFGSGFKTIGEADKDNESEVMTLTPSSTIDSLRYKKTPLAQIVKDWQDSQQQILTLKLSNGGSIRVTPNHPLVDEDGKIRRADAFKVGDSLVGVGGSLIPIASIAAETIHGKVYNVKVASSDLKENIVVAQGVLNGSIYYQNDGVKHLNRIMLRQITIPKTLF